MKNTPKMTLIMWLTGCLCSWGQPGEVTVKLLPIPLDLELPETMGSLDVTWNSSGMDASGDIYTVWCDQKGSVKKDSNKTPYAYSDSALLRFNAASETFEVLGSLSEVLREHKNWMSGEFVEKGHTPLPIVGDWVYIGTMEFHSLEGDRAFVTSEMSKYRGAHLIRYHIESGKFEDVSKDEPGGVLFPNQGIIALDELPEFHSIVCLSIPKGDVALYNYRTQRIEARFDGPEEEFGNVIYRNVVACPDGRVFFGFCDVGEGASGRLWMLDIKTRKLQKVMEMPSQVFNGLAKSRDRKDFYAVTQFSDVFHFDNVERTVEHLGRMIPDEMLAPIESEGIHCKVYGVHLSPDEGKLYAIPLKNQRVPLDYPFGRIWENGNRYAGSVPIGVVEFDLQSKVPEIIFDFNSTEFKEQHPDPLVGYLMCSQLMDHSGTFYMTRNSRPGLIKVDVSNRLKGR